MRITSLLSRPNVVLSLVAMSFSGAAFAALPPSNSVAGTMSPEVGPQYAGRNTYNYKTGEVVSSPAVVSQYVYDNVNAPSTANFGYSEAKTNNPTFGDTLNMVNTGTLDEFAFSLFNSTSGGNVGTITGGSVDVEFFRQSDSSNIGGFLGNFTLSSALPAGSFTFIDFTNLATLGTPINFDTANVIVTQKVTITGASTRNGVVSLNPINIGTSPSTVFLSSSATAAGFYNFNPAGTQSNFGYLVGVTGTPEPGSIMLGSLGMIGLAIRRRAAR